MIMILILHADFFSIGEPTTSQAISNTFTTFIKVFFEMLSNVSVDLFVLISGYFSIKFSFKGLINLIFQCVFILTLMFLIGLITHQTTITKDGVLECLFMTNNANWFVKSYLGLFILSPILNLYINNSNKAQLKLTLIVFYTFQTIYGCLLYSPAFINFGSSTFSFVGLYLLAGYVRRHGSGFYKYGIIVWLSSLILSTLWYFVPLYFGYLPISYMAFHYSSPNVIIGAVGLLLLAASKRPRHNRVINFVAASCFTVYLYHVCNTWTSDKYQEIARCVYSDYSGFKYLGIIGVFIIAVFLGGIVIDQIRKISWTFMNNFIFERNAQIASPKK